MTEREKEREKLIELLEEADQVAQAKGITDYKDAIADNADHLLSNGVIVPPCRVGGKIYWYNMGGEIVEADVRKIMYAVRHPHGFEYDIGFEDFGKTVFLTGEEALKALKKRSEGK